MTIDLEKANAELADKPPEEITRWALEQDGRAIVTTNFGPHEAAILHMCVSVAPEIPVVWMDSGYFTPATYRFAHRLIQDMNLNMHIYSPIWTRAYRDVVMDGTPDMDSPHFEEFTRQVKLEPFERAMKDMNPDIWLTAVRRDQTAHREGMQTVSQDPRGFLKVAPVLDWDRPAIENYLQENGLPIEHDYFDPTKVLTNRECGLHLNYSI